MKNRILFLVFISVFFALSCSTSSKVVQPNEPVVSTPETLRIAFYNIENLFDIYDDPKTKDDDFTPEGRQKWTADRYQKKLDDLAKVLEGMQFPEFIGLCEVENEQVLKDLIEKTALNSSAFEVVHYDSPDVRGIDVGFLYQKKHFRLLHSEFIRIQFPREVVEDYTTRDILYVKGILRNRDTLHFFVNHWPSRRDGLAASEPKRTYVASQLKLKTDAIFAQNISSKIIIMGDFNDECDNKSVSETLGAVPIEPSSTIEEVLVNCFSTLDKEGTGSYNYRGNWNMLDQIIVSNALLTESSKIQVKNPEIFREEWMMYKSDRFGPTPNRTYGGPNYYGGFSDHLPVLVELEIR